MRNTFFSFLILFALPCIVFPGCSGGADFSVEMVEGTITLDGVPLVGATIGFSPIDGEGIPAVGKTNETGKFILTATQGGEFGKGTMLGKYNVSVTKEQLEREYTSQELQRMDAGGPSPNIPVISIVPKKYNDPNNSGLTAEVVRGKNTFNFALESDAR